MDKRYANPDSDPRGPYVLADLTSPFDRPSLQYEWHGRIPPKGRSWRYSLEHVEQFVSEGLIIFPRSGLPRLKRYLSEARIPEPDSTPDFFVRRAMRALAELIARNPECLRKIEWRDLERVLREVFERIGFETELTRSGKDGGFDLRLVLGSFDSRQEFLVEVKHWVRSRKRPGYTDVKALFDVVVKAGNVRAGLLLSSNGFAKSAVHGRTEVQQKKICLGGEEKIISLCQEYLKSASGLWVPSTDLAELLIQGTI